MRKNDSFICDAEIDQDRIFDHFVIEIDIRGTDYARKMNDHVNLANDLRTFPSILSTIINLNK